MSKTFTAAALLVTAFAATFPVPVLSKCCATADPKLANVCAAAPFFCKVDEGSECITDEAVVALMSKESGMVVAVMFGDGITCVRLVAAADVVFLTIEVTVSMVICPCVGTSESRFRASSVPTKVLQKKM